MGDRYTSPETSRRLAEAGVEQEDAERVWCFDCVGVANENDEHEPHLSGYMTFPGTGPIGSTCVRALDLTDVLTELEKPRPRTAFRSRLLLASSRSTAFGAGVERLQRRDRPSLPAVLARRL